jgi:glycosyltransferase involved in cell wall biosynthesis
LKKKDTTICLAIHSLQAGGMERVMAELTAYFAKKEAVKVHLILYGIKRDIFYPLPDNVLLHKPSFAFDDTHRFRSVIKTLYYLRKKIKEIKPDAVLSFGEYWNNFVLMASLGLGYPVFVSDRSQPDKSLGKLQDKLRQWLYPFAKGVIAQTEKAKQIYQSLYRHSNITVIGNPIREIAQGGELIEKENIVLMVGRLIASKHQDKLIELFVKIDNPAWKLVIVGYDHLKQNHMARLQELVKQLGAEDRVVLAGKQSNVEAYYLKSKIFAFTSSSEGFPNVIGEAMSASLPVVAFDCVAGPSEMIFNNENGYLVPLFDYDDFQMKLSSLMSDEIRRNQFGLNAGNNIKKFSVENIGEQFFQFITGTDKNN